MRIQLPCRAVTCSHIQCFDALLYLQMNEKKPSWICPVCDKSALFNHLTIDGLFTEIINQVPSNCTEVQFMEDGSWAPVTPKKESCETVNDSSSKKRLKDERKCLNLTIKIKCNNIIVSFVFISHSLSTETSASRNLKKPKVETEVITLDSSSDEEEETSHHLNPPSYTTQSTTPILSSGSSSESEAPNLLPLPSPDSSTTSSTSPNNHHESNRSNSSFNPLFNPTSNLR